MIPQVSVIIPTYNREALLERSIKSVLAQEEVFFELIIIDDGSTDKTAQLIQTINDPRIRYFYQSNSGPSAARNNGISQAVAPFIAFLDSDDEWMPNKLKKQLDFFKEHSEYMICQTEEIWIRNGRRVNPMKKHQKMSGDIFEKSLELSIVSPSCVMMKRKFFSEIGSFDETLPVCEDYDLWLRASAQFPFGLVEEFLVVRYGGHSDQRSREFEVMDQFRIKSMLKLLESGTLTEEQSKLARKELQKKLEIVIHGSKKRNKKNQTEQYEQLLSQYCD